MKSKLTIMLCAACLCLWTGCRPQQTERQGHAKDSVITVSIEPLRYIAERIAGDDYKVTTLVPKGSSPETYEPTPEQMMQLSGSIACFTVGDLGFERTWTGRLQQAAPGVPFIATADGIERMEGHAHGHSDEAEGDPHVWTSPARMATIAQRICEALCQTDTARAELFKSRLRGVLEEIRATDDSIRTLLGNASPKAFLIYHPALTYFAHDYGWTQIAIEKDGKEPSPAQLADLIRRCKAQRVRTIFVQQEFDRRNAELIARETGTRITVINPLAYDWAGELLKIAQTLHAQ